MSTDTGHTASASRCSECKHVTGTRPTIATHSAWSCTCSCHGSRDNTITRRCARCRLTWREIRDTAHSNGTGHRTFCTRCLARVPLTDEDVAK